MTNGGRLMAGIFMALAMAGCATGGGRNYQTDIDALNARITALQGQLAAKDEEMSNMTTQLNDQRMAREAAETALRASNEANRRMTQAALPSKRISDLK